jgi:hypothetical protein
MQFMERIFTNDKMPKRERVEATLNRLPVDRCALLEQVSYNPAVIADWTGKDVGGSEYTFDDICEVIRKTVDLAMPPHPPRGTSMAASDDGFVIQYDNWTSRHVSRPFADEHGACAWLGAKTKTLLSSHFDAAGERDAYRVKIRFLQEKIGETVVLDFSSSYSMTGLCGVYDAMGLEIFTFFQMEYPEVLKGYLEAHLVRAERVVHSIADPALSPVVLIPEDFATKQGPLFSPAFLGEFHYPYVKRLTNAWHEHDVKVIYRSYGNWKRCIPDLAACGVDGFHCLERNCGMDIVELKKAWPEMVWAGGVDGVDLMELGTPAKIKAEVRRQIRETDALRTGGMFVASSSEIKPSIPPENFRAMVEAVSEYST